MIAFKLKLNEMAIMSHYQTKIYWLATIHFAQIRKKKPYPFNSLPQQRYLLNVSG